MHGGLVLKFSPQEEHTCLTILVLMKLCCGWERATPSDIYLTSKYISAHKKAWVRAVQSALDHTWSRGTVLWNLILIIPPTIELRLYWQPIPANAVWINTEYIYFVAIQCSLWRQNIGVVQIEMLFTPWCHTSL